MTGIRQSLQFDAHKEECWVLAEIVNIQHCLYENTHTSPYTGIISEAVLKRDTGAVNSKTDGMPMPLISHAEKLCFMHQHENNANNDQPGLSSQTDCIH